MSTVGLNNVCNNVTIANSVSNVIQTVSWSISWLSYAYLKKKAMRNNEWCLKYFSVWFVGYELNSPQTIEFIWCDSLPLFASLSCWEHDELCPTMYSVFTHWVVNFEISSIVPGCCIVVEWNVTFFPIEHKTLRFRHKLLYVQI